MTTWQTQEAKQHFSEVVRKAHDEGPQQITYRGTESAYVVSAADFHKLKMKKRKGSIIDFFQKSPLVNSNLKIERRKDEPRDFDL